MLSMSMNANKKMLAGYATAASYPHDNVDVV